MRRNSVAVLFLVTLSACATQRRVVETSSERLAGWTSTNFEVMCDVVGSEGTQVLTVASFGNEVSEAMATARLHAVQAILFKGVQTSVCNVPPLIQPRAFSEQDASWFTEFLRPGGAYLQFVNQAGDMPIDLIHSGRRVKAYSLVVVDRNRLRDRLVAEGIIAPLGDVFSVPRQ